MLAVSDKNLMGSFLLSSATKLKSDAKSRTHGLLLGEWLRDLPELSEFRGEISEALALLRSGSAKTLAEALGELRSQIKAALPLSVGTLVFSASRESSPQIFAESVTGIARAYESAGDFATPVGLYVLALQALPEGKEFQSLRERLQTQMNQYQGTGSLAGQVEMFARRLPHELQNGSMLVGMMAAGLANPIGARLVGGLLGSSVRRGAKLILANVGGILADGLAFESASRGVLMAQGKAVGSFSAGLGHAYWMIGNLRMMGLAGKTLSKSAKFSRAITTVARHRVHQVHRGIHSAFEYGGIYLSQTQGHFVGIEQGPMPYAWMQSAFTLFHFKTAGASLRALAPGFGSLTQRLQLETAEALRSVGRRVSHHLTSPLSKPLPHFVFATDSTSHQSSMFDLSSHSNSLTPVRTRPGKLFQGLDSHVTKSVDVGLGSQAQKSPQGSAGVEVGEIGKLLDRDFPYLPNPQWGSPTTHLVLEAGRLARLTEYDAERDLVRLRLLGHSGQGLKAKPRKVGETALSGKALLGDRSIEAMATWSPPIVEPPLAWLRQYFAARIPWLNYQILRFSELDRPRERRQIFNPRVLLNGSRLPAIDSDVLTVLDRTRQTLLQPALLSNWLVDFTYSVLKRMHVAGEKVGSAQVLTDSKHHPTIKKYVTEELMARADKLGFNGHFTIKGDSRNITRIDFLNQVERGNIIFDEVFAPNDFHGWPPHAVAAIFLAEHVPDYQRLYRYQGSYSKLMPQGSTDLWARGNDSLGERTYFRNAAHLNHSILILLPALHPVSLPYFSGPY